MYRHLAAYGRISIAKAIGRHARYVTTPELRKQRRGRFSLQTPYGQETQVDNTPVSVVLMRYEYQSVVRIHQTPPDFNTTHRGVERVLNRRRSEAVPNAHPLEVDVRRLSVAVIDQKEPKAERTRPTDKPSNMSTCQQSKGRGERREGGRGLEQQRG